MAYQTMSFSRTSSGYNAENGDYIDFTPSGSLSFGSLYKCTDFNISITGGITSATTSGRDHEINVELCFGSTWRRVWSGTKYLPAKGTTGYTISFTGTIPEAYQAEAAANGITDIRLQQSGSFALRGANASGTAEITYVDYVTDCGAPTSVLINGSASNITVSTDKATLSWSGANSGVNNPITGYRLFYQDSTDGSSWSGWYEYKDVSSTSSSGSIEVELGSIGSYRMFGVATIGSAGESYGSSIASSPTIQRVRTACGAPTSISVASNNVAANASVELSWSGATAGTDVSIKGYDIYRSTSATGTYTKITTVTTTATSGSVNVTAPSDNGSYYYKIVTLSSVAGYDSPQSSTYAILTCKITACGAPTSVALAATSSTGSSVRLSWSGAIAGTNNSISGYYVQRRESADGASWGSWSIVDTTTNAYLDVAPPTTAGNYYQYQVRTLGSAGSSYNSDWKASSNTLRRSYTACGAPTACSLSVSTSTGSNATLSWSGATSGYGNTISSYEIQRAESSDGSTWGSWDGLTTVTTTATSGSVSVAPPITAGNYYKFRVRTRGSAGSSYYSGWKESTNTIRRNWTACGAPTACAVSSTLATGNVTLRWSGATAGYGNSITGYKIQRCESSDGSTWGSWDGLTTVSSTSTSESLTVSPPSTAGNYYKYRVLTMGSAGSSYYSGYKESTNTLRRDWTACGAPTSCAVDNILSLVATTLRWSGATAGYSNTISKYEVQRRSKAPGGSWSAWSAFETTSGTSLSVSPPATAGHYYQYRVRAQGTAGEAYYSDWKESTNTLRKAHKTIPAFTDPTLIVGQTDVKAVHITELQNVMSDILLPFMGANTVAFTELERDSDAKHWGDHVQEIKAAIDSTGFAHDSWVAMQDEVTADVIEQLRRVIRTM